MLASSLFQFPTQGLGFLGGVGLRDLLRGQASAFRVSKQTVAAARNVPNVKSDWCHAARAGIHLLIRKIATPSLDILFSEFERVQDRPLDGRDIGQRAA